MKYTKICPKCRSSNIVRMDGYAAAGDAGSNFIQTGFFAGANVNRYICCNCGFTEEWIDQEDIEKVLSSKRAKR